MTVDDLLQLVPKLITKIDSLETELKQTKLTMGNAIMKLVKKVKKIEDVLKRRRVVLTNSEDEDAENSSKQGRNLQEEGLDEMVRSIMKGKSKVFETPRQGKTLGEVDISPEGFKAAETLAKVLTQRTKTYKKNVNTTFEEINSDESIIPSPKKGQREGKAVLEEKSQSKRIKKQIREEQASLAEIVRLQAQEKAENARKAELQRHDALIAKRMQDELELSETQKNRMAQVQEAAKYYTEEDWDFIRAKLEANRDLSSKVLSIDFFNDDFGQLKKLKPDELKEEFDKYVEKVEKFIPINSKLEASKLKRTGRNLQAEVFKKQKITDVPDVPKSKSVKREEEFKEDVEAYMDERVDEPSSEEFQIGSIPQGSAPAKFLSGKFLGLGDLKTMFDPPSTEDAVWSLTHQQKVLSWRYFHSCVVHCLTLEAAHIYMLTEVKYPLPSRVCQAMLEKKLIGDRKDELANKLYGYQLTISVFVKSWLAHKIMACGKGCGKSIYMVDSLPKTGWSRDLWKICKSYGKVVNIYIPNRKSKVGKRFSFVRFVMVEDIDRLVGNLCNIWIGRLYLHANVVRFERARKPYNSDGFAHTNVHAPSGPYTTAVKGNTPLNVHITPLSSVPTLVLDDSCVIERDLSRHVMGSVKDLNSIPKLQTLLTKEGFPEDAVQDFVSDERVVWVDIEGIPFNVWSRETFLKIGKKWGETMDIKDNLDSSFAQKRLCIKTKQADNILEKFKESVYTSDDESVQGAKNKSVGSQYRDEDSEDDSDVDGVSETIFGDKPSSPNNYNGEMVTRKENGHVEAAINNEAKKVPTPLVNTKVMNNSHEVQENVDVMNNSNGQSAYQNDHNVHSGDSILGLMEDMIRVGQSMGYTMEGCLGHKTKKEWVKELNIKHNVNFLVLQETKMDQITHMDVKFMWGNSNYQFVSSDSVGNSGGILCVWEATVFKKDYVTVLDNFIAIYGTWISCNSKVLNVVIYAPQQPSHKRVLWKYILTLLVRWNGETIIMGDFNEVRSNDERLGSVFNQFSARNFDHFITSSGLVDVKLEGSIVKELSAIDKDLDRRNAFDVVLLKRMELMRQLQDINQMEARDSLQKSKIKKAIEGDENLKFFLGIINKKRS
ncbi:RNA-directed DNA polymerase, eukaryota [Tanacetum coccineum]